MGAFIDTCHLMLAENCFPVFIQYGRTPLHLAANNGSLEVVRHLCLAGANIDTVTNVSHRTAFYLIWCLTSSLHTLSLSVKFSVYAVPFIKSRWANYERIRHEFHAVM